MKKIILSLLLVMTIVVLVGCGGGSTPADTKQEETTKNQTTEKETSANTIETDLSKLVIVTEDYPPMNYIDENGELAGTSTKLVEGALTKLGLDKSIIKVYEWAKSYDMALNNDNTLIYSMIRTPVREDKFKWVAPVGFKNVYIYKLKSRNDIKINSIEDLKNYKSATMANDFIEQILLQRGFELEKNIISNNDHVKALESLFTNKADLWVGTVLPEGVGKMIKDDKYKASDVEVAYIAKEIPAVSYLAASLNTSDEIVEKFKEAMPVVEIK